jgi:RNA polymerase sigma factor (TIGR02999 family)
MQTPDMNDLLDAANRGDDAALAAAFARVYAELKQLARKQLAASSNSTLNTTGLLHEAYLKLTRAGPAGIHNRTHFFALSAKVMRQIVIDHARAKVTDKRGGLHAQLVNLEAAADVVSADFGPDDLLRLEKALLLLETDEPRLASLIDLHFFAGLSTAEIASLQSINERTVSRDWRRARAILYDALYVDG